MSWLRKSLGLAALCGAAGALSTACEDNESMLFVHGVVALDDTTDCFPEASEQTTRLASGRYDLTLSNGAGYKAALLVGSQLTPRASRDQLRTETARFILEGAEVTVTDASDNVIPLAGKPNPYSTRGTGSLAPATGQTASIGILWADIIPGGVDLPNDLVLARVRAYGRTLGGTEIESGEFVFPIQVCRGCLISYPASAADETATPAGGAQGRFICRTVGEGTEDSGACFPGQDVPTPCTECASINAACEDPCQNCAVRKNNPQCDGTPAPACPP